MHRYKDTENAKYQDMKIIGSACVVHRRSRCPDTRVRTDTGRGKARRTCGTSPRNSWRPDSRSSVCSTAPTKAPHSPAWTSEKAARFSTKLIIYCVCVFVASGPKCRSAFDCRRAPCSHPRYCGEDAHPSPHCTECGIRPTNAGLH